MPGVNGHFELTVEAPGTVALPLDLAGDLAVAPGDLLSIEVGPAGAYVCLEIYHELLPDNWDAVSPENRWRFLFEFLCRPLTSLDPQGGLLIPQELFPLLPGDTIDLHVMSLGLVHRVFLYKGRAQ